MDVSLFDYELPAQRIAQQPVSPRDAARMLVVHRSGGVISHRYVRELAELLAPGDLLVINDTRVLPARVDGRKPSGGRVELLLLEPVEPEGGQDGTAEDRPLWRVQLGASRAPRPGVTISLGDEYRAVLVDGPFADGTATVSIAGPGGARGLMQRHGRMPLPPYIRRDVRDRRHGLDRDRYQTVFARVPGAIAAPTAGLHITGALLDRLRERGVAIASVTLHVGEGTFRPIRVERTEEIELHPEAYEVPAATGQAVATARARRGRVVAVGTTVVRALESRPALSGRIPQPGAGTTRLCVLPGHRFRYVDALLTNFHLPRSSLLMLVAAFAGRGLTLRAYGEALASGYRFYSYGDAMLVL